MKFTLRMQNYDWSLGGSLLAIVFAQISQAISHSPLMESITALSAVVLCLTAIVKFADLVLEKYQKWKEKLKTPPRSDD